MEFTDRLLTCIECGKEFIFTAGEQLFFYDKQFKNDPKRCKPCKSKRYGAAPGKPGTGPAAAGISRTETRTHCSECGIETTVPFRPTQGRPVLCRACFQSKRSNPEQPVAEAPPTDTAILPSEAAAALAAAQLPPSSLLDPPPLDLTSTHLEPPAEA